MDYGFEINCNTNRKHSDDAVNWISRLCLLSGTDLFYKGTVNKNVATVELEVQIDMANGEQKEESIC